MVPVPRRGEVRELITGQEGVICIMGPRVPISQVWKLWPQRRRDLPKVIRPKVARVVAELGLALLGRRSLHDINLLLLRSVPFSMDGRRKRGRGRTWGHRNHRPPEVSSRARTHRQACLSPGLTLTRLFKPARAFQAL